MSPRRRHPAVWDRGDDVKGPRARRTELTPIPLVQSLPDTRAMLPPASCPPVRCVSIPSTAPDAGNNPGRATHLPLPRAYPLNRFTVRFYVPSRRSQCAGRSPVRQYV
jgi:hypothetical protein